jgi:hypothetical protein
VEDGFEGVVGIFWREIHEGGRRAAQWSVVK